jgi:asparagine synthase (glutamine-hydrolysing)
MHRPLVEFMQAIPFEQMLRPGENRSLMRRALRNVLPEKIARRKTKGQPTEGLCRAVSREWKTLRAFFADSRVCAYGYTDQAPLLNAIDRSRNGMEVFTGPLLTTISLELWLRALEKRPVARNDYATLCGSTRVAAA